MGEPSIENEPVEHAPKKKNRIIRSALRNQEHIEPLMVSIETAIRMADYSVSQRTIERAIEAKELNGYQPGVETMVIPSEFLVWMKRFKK